MPRLTVVTPEKATGETKELYDVIKRAVSAVPNMYQGVGSSAPALESVPHIGEALKRGGLTAAEIEAIKLVVSEAYGCTYCLAAHSMLGKKAGLTDQEVINIRRGGSQQPKVAALVKFVSATIQPQARVSDEQLRALKAAGYSDAQITEALLTVAQTVFTNLFNRVHETTLDLPPAPAL
jgi:uncharacterized peroxidase-related enzyme